MKVCHYCCENAVLGIRVVQLIATKLPKLWYPSGTSINASLGRRALWVVMGMPSTACGDGNGGTHTVRVVMAMVRHSHVAAVDIVLAMAGVVIVLLKPVSTHTCTRHRTAVTLRLCDFLNYVDGCL